MPGRPVRTALSAAFVLTALSGCKQDDDGPAGSSKSATLPAPVASGLPHLRLPERDVPQVVGDLTDEPVLAV